MHKRLYVIFIATLFFFTPFAQINHNTSSRFAAMGAFCNSGSFEISHYVSWTDDWAKTPDGRVFSNKAPGSAVVGLPLYCLISKAASIGQLGKVDAVEREWKLRYLTNLLLCMLLQVLPWIWMCGLWDRELEARSVSSEARLYAQVALLFGTTPAILMNVWIGYPMLVLFSMLGLLAILRQKPALLGLSLGMMLLTEYSSLLVFPGALLAFWLVSERKLSALPRIALGAAAPALVWSLYHYACYGSPFVIANKFQNPMYQDKLTESINLWGIFGLPPLRIFGELLFGWYRGLLFSQPWVLLSAIALPIVAVRERLWKSDKPLLQSLIYCCFGLAGLLFMNASFGGWHGGTVAGPRYLSAALPVFAVPVALSWKGLPAWLRKALWGALAFSCLVFAMAEIIGPTSGMWVEWVNYVGTRTGKFVWRATAFVALAWGVFSYRRTKDRMPKLTSLGAIGEEKKAFVQK